MKHQVGKSSMEQPVRKGNSFIALVAVIILLNALGIMFFVALASFVGAL